jgi:transposase InsO family protein
LVTDAYSRKIIGYCLYPTLKKEGTINALQMALNSLSPISEAPLIHHSDRGLQYCCADYIKLLQDRAIHISMTEKGDPYENAIAERINGILKEEFALDQDFKHFGIAELVVKKSIDTYNQLRPHLSCDNLTPDQASKKQGLLKSKWKRRSAMA